MNNGLFSFTKPGDTRMCVASPRHLHEAVELPCARISKRVVPPLHNHTTDIFARFENAMPLRAGLLVCGVLEARGATQRPLGINAGVKTRVKRVASALVDIRLHTLSAATPNRIITHSRCNVPSQFRGPSAIRNFFHLGNVSGVNTFCYGVDFVTTC